MLPDDAEERSDARPRTSTGSTNTAMPGMIGR